ncbi:MAG: triose-phosphate isomerase [Firmicutes bacterium]|nr:triose-phosphate isomerase [Bacillota bacterium]
MTRRPLIAGNWKMYKTIPEARAFAAEFGKLYDPGCGADTCLCAPYPQLVPLKEALLGTRIGVGAQNCHFEEEGAYTGEVSVNMLKDIGVDYCIIGHSERRQYYNETDEAVNLKVKELLYESHITPILCVGENLEQRESGRAEEVVKYQVERDIADLTEDMFDRLVIAYEPIWAIGTGKTATPRQAGEMCTLIRQIIAELYDAENAERVRILYGGSVKPANVKEIMAESDVDGALVGGASLKADTFIQIVEFGR